MLAEACGVHPVLDRRARRVPGEPGAVLSRARLRRQKFFGAARLLKALAKLSHDQKLAEARQAKADKKAGKKSSMATAVVAIDKKKRTRERLQTSVAKQAGVSERALLSRATGLAVGYSHQMPRLKER
jgi:hypothetical protein